VRAFRSSRLNFASHFVHITSRYEMGASQNDVEVLLIYTLFLFQICGFWIGHLRQTLGVTPNCSPATCLTSNPSTLLSDLRRPSTGSATRSHIATSMISYNGDAGRAERYVFSVKTKTYTTSSQPASRGIVGPTRTFQTKFFFITTDLSPLS
jgi:hypothetical protein